MPAPQAGEGPSLPHLLGGKALRTSDSDEAGTGGSEALVTEGPGPQRAVCEVQAYVFQ